MISATAVYLVILVQFELNERANPSASKKPSENETIF